MNHSTQSEMDPFNLQRFVEAQLRDYDRAIAEIRGGRKRSHWMWYVFPQLIGLGRTSTSRYYAISGLEEARAYLEHPLLGPRLRDCSEALLSLHNLTAHEIFGSPDDIKLSSSMTLFALAAGPDSPYSEVLERYFSGRQDERTLNLLDIQ